MKQYKHIFDALVNGEQVEHFYSGDWSARDPHTVASFISVSEPAGNFRIKPKAININGHEVPEPVREPLEYGQGYYLTSVTQGSEGPSSYPWDGGETDMDWLPRGLIHLTREAAEAHAKALLSFTQVKERPNED